VHRENLVSTLSAFTSLAEDPVGSVSVFTVDTTCARTSLAPQLTGTATGRLVSGGVMLDTSKSKGLSATEGDARAIFLRSFVLFLELGVGNGEGDCILLALMAYSVL